MIRYARRTLSIGVLLLLVIGGWQARAFSVESTDPTVDHFSPLFERRLEVGIENLDDPADRVHMAILPPFQRDEPPDGTIPETPASGNPLSVCLGSACLGSLCLGSGCIASKCIGSACVTSGCATSGCLSSACAGSTCAGSACLGSVCFGSGCTGSVCAGTACLGSACTQCTGSARDGRRLG